jgi:predicted RNase H-like HicB family nuclease
MNRREPEAFVASKENWTTQEWARAERYTFTVGWSTVDEMFIASAVEIPYAMSHGRTPEEAVHNAVDAVATVIDAAADNPAIVIPDPSEVTV